VSELICARQFDTLREPVLGGADLFGKQTHFRSSIRITYFRDNARRLQQRLQDRSRQCVIRYSVQPAVAIEAAWSQLNPSLKIRATPEATVGAHLACPHRGGYSHFNITEVCNMSASAFPTSTPQSGEWVRWRDSRHARALKLGWADALGEGPFEVVSVVDRSDQDLPAGLILRTPLGDREISEVWLVGDSDEAHHVVN
jgi:hypothetical protein